MKRKKTKLTNDRKYTVVSVVLIAVLFVAFTLFQRSQVHPGLGISCTDGEFIKFHFTSPPPLCIACVDSCTGVAKIYLDGNLVCESQGTKTSIGTPEAVVIPCDKIDSLKGQEITVDYSVNSSYGYFERNNMVILVE